MQQENILNWLQNWYFSQCDGEWEHDEGLKLVSSDNPGWIVEINLKDTSLKELTIPYYLVEKSELDWYGIKIENSIFYGVGDPMKLEFLLKKFKEIVEDSF